MQRADDGHVAVLDLLDPSLLPFSRVNGSLIPDRDPQIGASAPSPTDPDYPRLIAEFVRAHVPDQLDGQPVGFGKAFFGSVTCDDAFARVECQEELLPLIRSPGARFVSLQYTDCAHELASVAATHGSRIEHWQEAIDDYDETAALVAAAFALPHENVAPHKVAAVLEPLADQRFEVIHGIGGY